MSHLTTQDFLDYIRAFNAKDYEKQHSFYASDVTLTIPDPVIGTLLGSEGIMNHYRGVHDLAEETVVPMTVVVDPEQNKIFYIMETYFVYKKDTDKAVHSYKVKKGDVLRMTVWAYYVNEGKKMKKIVCNLFKDEFLGAIDVEEAIRDTETRADPGIRL